MRSVQTLWAGLGLLPVLSFAMSVRAAQTPVFTDVTAERGLGVADPGPGYGAGAAIADFDGDGDLDIWLGTGRDFPDQVWRNLGDGTFEDAAAELGLDWTGGSRAALWIDFSGDGRLDLITGGDCFSQAPSCFDGIAKIRFNRQREDGSFEDITDRIGPIPDGLFDTGSHRAGFIASDFDRDGWLDLAYGTWNGEPHVLRGLPGGGFADITAASGIVSSGEDHWQPAAHDFDRDGWPDLAWAMDFTGNHLWRNRRDGTFEDLAPALGIDNAMNDMGLALGDIDADGDFDMFVTEIWGADTGFHNVLFRNDTAAGVLAFEEIGVAAGVSNSGFGWGATFLDVDHDRDLDLAVANGWFNGIGFDDRTRLYVNQGGPSPSFVDRATEAGIDDDAWGVTMLAFDMDRDGDLDLLETRNYGFGFPVRLLENRLDETKGAGGSLTVQLRQPGANRDAIGAEIRAEIEGDIVVRRISAGTSHLGQEPPEAHLGTGSAREIERLEVRWPDGARTVRQGLSIGGVLVIERSPCAGTADLDGDGRIAFDDLLALLATWGPCPEACPEDVDRSGDVNGKDLMALLRAWGDCDAG